MSEATNRRRVLGCDVGRDSVVVFDSLTGTGQTLDNTPKALRRLVSDLSGDVLVVCEATGGHEATLLSVAVDAGLPAHRADPRKASAFIRSLRGHGKTDRIDAQGLCRYGLERGRELAPWQPPTESQTALRGLVRLRADLVRDRSDDARRLKAPGDGPDKRHIRATIEALNSRIAAIETDIDRRIKDDRQLADTVATIRDIPGCGAKTAIALAALMPELGHMNRRQAAALAGLAPHPNQSGSTDGYRRVRGGRRDIKSALFMAAMAARRFNPKLRDHYDSLRLRGKKPIVAIVAIARKLITIINARIRDALKPNQKPQKELC